MTVHSRTTHDTPKRIPQHPVYIKHPVSLIVRKGMRKWCEHSSPYIVKPSDCKKIPLETVYMHGVTDFLDRQDSEYRINIMRAIMNEEFKNSAVQR